MPFTKGPRIHVLRLGHRVVRDDRTTTHVGLAARAFGAEKIYLVDVERSIKDAVDAVVKQWGGPFETEIVDEWRPLIKRWKQQGGLVVHLTMYGLPVNRVISSIRQAGEDVLIVIGAEKIPPEVFQLADYNVAMGNQPHSEIAALAVFLDRFSKRASPSRKFKGARLRIIPSPKGKKMVKLAS